MNNRREATENMQNSKFVSKRSKEEEEEGEEEEQEEEGEEEEDDDDDDDDDDEAEAEEEGEEEERDEEDEEKKRKRKRESKMSSKENPLKRANTRQGGKGTSDVHQLGKRPRDSTISNQEGTSSTVPASTDTSSSSSPPTTRLKRLTYEGDDPVQIDMQEELTEENLVAKRIVDRPFAKHFLGLLFSIFIATFQSLYDWAESETKETIAAKQGKGSYAGHEIGEGPAAKIKKFVEAYNRGQGIMSPQTHGGPGGATDAMFYQDAEDEKHQANAFRKYVSKDTMHLNEKDGCVTWKKDDRMREFTEELLFIIHEFQDFAATNPAVGTFSASGKVKYLGFSVYQFSLSALMPGLEPVGNETELFSRSATRSLFRTSINYILKASYPNGSRKGESRHIIGVGDPGIGKSFNLIYCIQLLSQGGYPFTYSACKKRLGFAFIPERDENGKLVTQTVSVSGTSTTYNAPKYHVWNSVGQYAESNTGHSLSSSLHRDSRFFHLIDPKQDGGYHDKMDAHNIMASSADKRHFHRDEKDKGFRQYLSPWSRTEVRAVAESLADATGDANLDADVIMKRFQVCGGALRYLINSKAYHARSQTLWEEMSGLSEEALRKIVFGIPTLDLRDDPVEKNLCSIRTPLSAESLPSFDGRTIACDKPWSAIYENLPMDEDYPDDHDWDPVRHSDKISDDFCKSWVSLLQCSLHAKYQTAFVSPWVENEVVRRNYETIMSSVALRDDSDSPRIGTIFESSIVQFVLTRGGSFETQILGHAGNATKGTLVLPQSEMINMEGYTQAETVDRIEQLPEDRSQLLIPPEGFPYLDFARSKKLWFQSTFNSSHPIPAHRLMFHLEKLEVVTLTTINKKHARGNGSTKYISDFKVTKENFSTELYFCVPWQKFKSYPQQDFTLPQYYDQDPALRDRIIEYLKKVVHRKKLSIPQGLP